MIEQVSHLTYFVVAFVHTSIKWKEPLAKCVVALFALHVCIDEGARPSCTHVHICSHECYGQLTSILQHENKRKTITMWNGICPVRLSSVCANKWFANEDDPVYRQLRLWWIQFKWSVSRLNAITMCLTTH